MNRREFFQKLVAGAAALVAGKAIVELPKPQPKFEQWRGQNERFVMESTPGDNEGTFYRMWSEISQVHWPRASIEIVQLKPRGIGMTTVAPKYRFIIRKV